MSAAQGVNAVQLGEVVEHGRALDHFEPILEWIVAGISLIGVGVLVWGVARGGVSLLRYEFGSRGLHDLRRTQSDLRQRLGFYLLLGLELLIAADIIETMIRPTLEQLGILAGISAIRIVTSYSLAKELEHERAHQEANHANNQAKQSNQENGAQDG